MTLKEIRDWIKPQIEGINLAYIGKTDPTQEKAICIYNRAIQGNNVAIGGCVNTSYMVKGVSLLVQWDKYCETSEVKAQEIYNILFRSAQPTINGVECFFSMMNTEPVFVGANENGIYEYVIDFNIIVKEG